MMSVVSGLLLFDTPDALTPGCCSTSAALPITGEIATICVALGYFALTALVFWLLRKRPDLSRRFRLLALCVCVFSAVSGLSYVAQALAAWYPIHALRVVALLATAVSMIALLLYLRSTLPAFAWVPSARALALANARLRNEVAGHEATLRELQAVGRELEKSVAERTRELSLARASFETALRGSHVTVFTQDRDLTYTSISNSMFGLGVDQILTRSDADVLPADSRAAIIALKQRVLQTGQPEDSEVSVREEDQLRWYDFHVEPLRDTAGDISGIVCAAVDVTGRKENEAHLRLLMRELTHRSKNLLAVIQAMARQTGRDASSVSVFLDQFGSRLQALATSHDLLIQESWHGASLFDLVKSQLAHHIDAKDPQVTVEGPMILLRPESAQNLGLALHELATNAAKYGALSVATGQVSVKWRKVPAEGGNAVDIIWSETGGPPVEEPSRTGFGLLVIKRNLARALDADVDLTFAREGVQCRVSIPASQIQSIERKT